MPARDHDPPFPTSTMPRVLIVDDEPTPRTALCRMVRGMGYEARAAGDGREALRYLQQHPGQIRLLLADLLLPLMDGGELAERARDLEPGLRVVLMAGSPHGPAAELLAGYGDLPRLEKPVRFGELYELLVERLGAPPTSTARPRPSGPARLHECERPRG
jgi:two-component system, cell cycle sensor histidine kinase and response regulator CckA